MKEYAAGLFAGLFVLMFVLYVFEWRELRDLRDKNAELTDMMIQIQIDNGNVDRLAECIVRKTQ